MSRISSDPFIVAERMKRLCRWLKVFEKSEANHDGRRVIRQAVRAGVAEERGE
jgi:hypothetical protein